jgi:hypothetical protein
VQLSESEFNDQVDSTSQFINWIQASSFEFMGNWKAERERLRLDRIRRGLPIRYLDPLNPGSGVYVCAKEGCEKELLPDKSIYWQSCSLRVCCQQHSL